MFIVIVLGVLLIIGVAYIIHVYKKVKAFRASTACEKVKEAFNKVKEAKKAEDAAWEAFWAARAVREATPESKALDEAREALEATPEWKAEREALCAYQKMYIAHLEANSDLRKVKRFAKSILKEEMDGEAW